MYLKKGFLSILFWYDIYLSLDFCLLWFKYKLLSQITYGTLAAAGNTVLEVVETLRGGYLGRRIVRYCPCRLNLIHRLFMSVRWFLSMMRRRISLVTHSYCHKDLSKVVGTSSHELNFWKLRKNEVFLFFRCSPKCRGYRHLKTTSQLQHQTISPFSTNSCNFNTIWGDFTEKRVLLHHAYQPPIVLTKWTSFLYGLPQLQ